MSNWLQHSSRSPSKWTAADRARVGRWAIVSAVLFGLVTLSSAQTVKITEYPLPAGLELPQGITTGLDGALWLTSNDGIGRLRTDGVVTNTYSVGSVSGLPNVA